MGTCQIADTSGERVYVVGDIHGCLDEMLVLLNCLREEEGFSDDDVMIFLGDYVDRGPSSKQVVDYMLAFQVDFPKTRFLMGNHEHMLLDFLGLGGRLGESYLYNGGLETVQSYGLTVFTPPKEMAEAIPVAHVKFFQRLEQIVRVDDFICVHAGLNPLRRLDAQNEDDVFWIRGDFIEYVHEFHHTVIFGHTPFREVVLDLPYKIGLDTGLVFGNKLSCLELRSGALFQVLPGGKQVSRSEVDLSSRSFA